MTQLTAVGLNLLAAVGALQLARGWPAAGAAPAVTPATRVVSVSVAMTMLAVFVSGFAAMGMEIVWFRHLTALLGSYRWVLSLILTVILVGIWLGALAGGALHRRVGQPVVLFVLAQALLVVGALAGLVTAETRAVVGEGLARPAMLALVLRELALPALMMGVTFPLANAIVQDAERAVGRRAGLLYLANTVGAVAGSLVAGFVLLPALGMQRAVTVLALAVLLGLVPLCVAAIPRASRQAVAAGGALAALGVAALSWASLPADYLVSRTLWPLRPGERRLAVTEGVTEVVSVTEMPGEGRALQTNGHLMSGTSPESQRYMRAFVHIPLLSQETPERVLVICFGVGNTAHAATLHPSVRRVDIVDLSRNVLSHADYFGATNGRVIRQPNVAVHVNDGRQHLKMRPPGSYDLVTLEPPPIAFAGVAALYSREFYALARSRLRPGGYLTQWLPVYQASPDAVLSMVRAFVDVFPETVLLSGWTDNLILMGTTGPRVELDPARVDARLAAAPRLREDLARVHLGTLTELVGTFVGEAQTLRAATDAYQPVTDDYPIQEYWARTRQPDPRLLSTLFDPSRVAAWCPGCFEDGRPRPGLEGLPQHLALLAAVYRDPVFHRYGATNGAGARRFRLPLDAAVVRAAIAGSPYLQRVFRAASAP
jgi:predicted membrane-bound spermidine synthase